MLSGYVHKWEKLQRTLANLLELYPGRSATLNTETKKYGKNPKKGSPPSSQRHLGRAITNEGVASDVHMHDINIYIYIFKNQHCHYCQINVSGENGG